MYDKIDADYTCQCDDSTPTLITGKMNSTISSVFTCRVVSFPVYSEVKAVFEGSKKMKPNWRNSYDVTRSVHGGAQCTTPACRIFK